MSQIKEVNLNAAKFFVGPNLVRLKGAADDYFTIAKVSDVGAVVSGIQGDAMLMTRTQYAYMGTLTLQQASSAVDTLLLLSEAGQAFPVKVDFNDFSFVGFAVVQNEGELAASLGTTTRTITLGMVKSSGNTAAGSGRTLQV